MLDGDTHLALFSTTLELHDTAGAVHNKRCGAGGGHIVQLLLEEFGGNFGELGRIGSTKTAAHFLFGTRYVFAGILDQLARGLLDLQTTAKVAGSMIGDLFAVVQSHRLSA